MKRKIIILLLIPVVFFVLIIGSIGAYDLFVFRPYMKDAQAILEETHPLHKNPPKQVVDLVVFFCGGEELIPSQVMRRLFYKRGYTHFDNLKGVFTWWFSTHLLNFHFNNKEILTLWCYFFPYEQGIGLNNAAKYYFNRDLDQLSDIEISQLLVIARNPSKYGNDPDELKRESAKLLEKYRKSHATSD